MLRHLMQPPDADDGRVMNDMGERQKMVGGSEAIGGIATLTTFTNFMQSLKERSDRECLGQAIQHFINWQLQNKQLPINLEE